MAFDLKLPRQKLFISLVAVLRLYGASFFAVAAFGGYTFVPSGRYRPIAGLASTDTFIWQPFYGTKEEQQK